MNINLNDDDEKQSTRRITNATEEQAVPSWLMKMYAKHFEITI